MPLLPLLACAYIAPDPSALTSSHPSLIYPFVPDLLSVLDLQIMSSSSHNSGSKPQVITTSLSGSSIHERENSHIFYQISQFLCVGIRGSCFLSSEQIARSSIDLESPLVSLCVKLDSRVPYSDTVRDHAR